MTSRPLVAASTIAVLICGFARPNPAQAVSVRDSAGVRIIENGPRKTAPIAFKLGTTALYDAGGLQDNPDNELSSRSGLDTGVFLANGALVVSDMTRLHLFDSHGVHVRAIGQRGSGPADFRTAGSICSTRGDTLVVSDPANGRVSVVTAAGVTVTTVPIDPLAFVPAQACFSDGAFVAFTRASIGVQEVSVTRLTLAGRSTLLGSHLKIGITDIAALFNPQLVAVDKRWYFGNGLAFEVLVFSETGALVSIIRTSDALVPLTRSDIEAGIRKTAGRAAPDVIDARVAEWMARPHLANWPSYQRFLVDETGRIWIQDYVTSALADSYWTAFDPAGRMIGRVLIPGTTDPKSRPDIVRAFRTNSVEVLRTDSDGALHISVYPLLPVH